MAIEAEALLDAGTPIEILYRNWRGETAVRSITNGLIRSDEDGGTQLGMSVWFGSTEWHPEPQWFLRAADVDKSAYRDFAMADILAWGPNAIARHRSALAEDTARAVEGMRERCAEVADGWIKVFGDREPKHVSAQTWAGDAVRDIAEVIRSLSLTKEAGRAGASQSSSETDARDSRHVASAHPAWLAPAWLTEDDVP